MDFVSVNNEEPDGDVSQPNLYGLFLQVGVELHGDGGRLSYINPRSFVSGQYFRNLRRFLAEHLDLRRFDMFDKRTDVFEGVLQQLIILTAIKTIGQSEIIRLREFSARRTTRR